jgi:hypothetical protein
MIHSGGPGGPGGPLGLDRRSICLEHDAVLETSILHDGVV